jgi:hypothetical protein
MEINVKYNVGNDSNLCNNKPILVTEILFV